MVASLQTWFPVLTALWLVPGVATELCVNSPYTRIIDSQIRRLRWLDLTHSDYINATLDAFVDNTQCSRPEPSSGAPINHRTMCPWDIVEDYDENRFPVSLNVAKCRCSTCSNNHVCKPVLYSIPVLVKQCQNGVLHWIRRQQLISVACTCTRPRVHYVKRKRTSRIRQPLTLE